MPTKKTEPKPKAARKPAATRRRKANAAPIGHEQIAERAYYLSLERAADPLANWLDAERELAA